MYTVTLNEPGKFTPSETTEPGAPGAGDVLVRVLVVGICGTDLHAFEGTQPFFTYPRILGHELAVEVIESGNSAGEFKPGDLCTVNPYMTCGEYFACLQGRTNCCAKMRVIGVHSDGGMRDRILLPARQLHKCEVLSPRQAPLVETLAVGLHAVGRAAVQAGDRVIVLGAGPIGLSVLEFLRLAGADIGVVEKMPERLEFAATRHGLSRYYPSHAEARQEAPSAVVFDCTGDRGSMEQSIHLLEQGGRLVFVGLINDSFSIFDPDLHRREATILGSRNSTAAEQLRVLRLMESGRIDTGAWPIEYASRATMPQRFPAWVHREAGVVKAVVDWS